MNIVDLFRWVSESNDPHSTEIRTVLQEKIEKRPNTSKPRTMFPNDSPILQELGTEQMKQIFKAARAIALYSTVDKRILDIFNILVPTKMLSNSFIIGTKFIPSKCSSYNRVSTSKDVLPSPFATTIPKSFEVLLTFHAYRMATVLVEKDHPITVKYYSNQPDCTRFVVPKTTKSGNRIGFAVQSLLTAWNAVALHLALDSFHQLSAPYVLFKEDFGLFQVLEDRSDGFAPLSQTTSLLNVGDARQTSSDCDALAWKRDEDMDKGLRLLTLTFFNHLHDLIQHPDLYSHDENTKWQHMSKYDIREDSLPSIFFDMPDDIQRCLKLQRSQQAHQPEVINLLETADHEITPNRSATPLKRKRSKAISIGISTSSKVSKVEDDDDDFNTASLLRMEAKSSKDIGGPSRPAQGGEAIKTLESKVRDYMKMFCRVYDVHFSDLMEIEEEESGHSLKGNVNLILTDPPYNIRSSKNKNNSDHDVITKEDMKQCVNLFAKMLVPGGHGVIFCAALQFHMWHKILANHIVGEGVDSDSDSDSESDSIMDSEKPVPCGGRTKAKEYTFRVEDVPLNFIRARNHYNVPPGLRRINHASIAEHAIHFWKIGSGNNEALSSTDYSLKGFINSSHTGWTNVMDNITSVPHHEKVLMKTKEGIEGMVRPEQKNVALMKELVSKFTSGGDVVVDLFGGTFSTAKACLDLPDHRIFVGSEMDQECVKLATPSLMAQFARQVLKKKTSILLKPGEKKDVEVYYKYLQETKKTGFDEYSVPPGLPPMQRFPSYITSMVGQMWGDGTFYEAYRTVPLNKWPERYRSLFYSVPSNILNCLELTVKGLCVKTSTVKHPQAGSGLFTNRVIGRGELVTTYYGILVYKELSGERDSKKIGEGPLQVTVEDFNNRAIELKARAKDSSGTRHPIFIVPAPFCCASLINDPRYLDGDEDYEKRHTKFARRANVQFEETAGTMSRDFLRSHNIITVRALRQLHIGEELFIDYGDRFMW